MGPTHVTEVLPEQAGLETACGVFESADRLFTCPGEITNSLIFHVGDIDRGESTRAGQTGPWPRVPTVGCDPITGLCGDA
jgi:hypothetical protein